MLTHKIDAITGVYDDLHEKMHEIDKTRKNNLMIYGLRPDFLPEIQSQLETKVHEIFKHNLQIIQLQEAYLFRFQNILRQIINHPQNYEL